MHGLPFGNGLIVATMFHLFASSRPRSSDFGPSCARVALSSLARSSAVFLKASRSFVAVANSD
jgi:hypothetical protein